MNALAGIFLSPPTDALAQHPAVPLAGSAALFAIAVVVGVIYTRRTRSPLFALAMVAGLTLYPLLVEPVGDLFIAVWYPTNNAIVATVFGRPMPWLAVFFYGAGIPLMAVAVWEIVKRGLPAQRLLLLIAALTIVEVPGEMLASHYGWMHYYGNHALMAGVPIYCITQNGGMFAVVAWMLGWLMPRMSGRSWLVMPFALAATLPVMALIATFPAYIAIADHAGPTVGWIAGIVSMLLNGGIVLACVYSPTLRRYREAGRVTPTTAGMPVRSAALAGAR